MDGKVLLDQSLNACQTSIEYRCVFFLQRRLAGCGLAGMCVRDVNEIADAKYYLYSDFLVLLLHYLQPTTLNSVSNNLHSLLTHQ